MPSAEPDKQPLVQWSGEAFRLFPTRFPPVNVYDGLIANDRHEEVVRIEALTNPRLRSEERLRTSLQGPSDARLQNWNLAPFAYGNPEGTTFFSEDRPCLELGLERQTALAISVTKREAFLAATNQRPTGLDMRMLRSPVDGLFWDLRGVEPCLAELTESDRRKLGANLPEGAQGILYNPVERPLGTCIAIIDGAVLKRSEQSTHFRYLWDGSRISLLYAFDRKGKTILAEELSGAGDVLAA
jgi:hypothetical protein